MGTSDPPCPQLSKGVLEGATVMLFYYHYKTLKIFSHQWKPQNNGLVLLLLTVSCSLLLRMDRTQVHSRVTLQAFFKVHLFGSLRPIEGASAYLTYSK